MPTKPELWDAITELAERIGAEIQIKKKDNKPYYIEELERLHIIERRRQALINVLRRRRARRNYPFVRNVGMNARVYYINNFNTDSNDVERIIDATTKRVNHALRGGMSIRSGLILTLHIFSGSRWSTKQFGDLRLEDLGELAHNLTSWNDLNRAEHENYTYNIRKITIRIIQENGGGCFPGRKGKSIKHGETICFSPRASNNNCLFSCINHITDNVLGKLSVKKCNDIRRKYGVADGEVIPLSIAHKICKEHFNLNVCITAVADDNGVLNTLEVVGNLSASEHFQLAENHYSVIKIRLRLKCPHCLTKYSLKHTCNASRVAYANKLKGNGVRTLICNNQEELENNMAEVIHYDIETYRQVVDRGGILSPYAEDNASNIHRPYIVGFTRGEAFDYFAGDDCMTRFVDYLISGDDGKERDKPRYVNAYNGANFDHYHITQTSSNAGSSRRKALLIMVVLLVLVMAISNYSIFVSICKGL